MWLYVRDLSIIVQCLMLSFFANTSCFASSHADLFPSSTALYVHCDNVGDLRKTLKGGGFERLLQEKSLSGVLHAMKGWLQVNYDGFFEGEGLYLHEIMDLGLGAVTFAVVSSGSEYHPYFVASFESGEELGAEIVLEQFTKRVRSLNAKVDSVNQNGVVITEISFKGKTTAYSIVNQVLVLGPSIISVSDLTEKILKRSSSSQVETLNENAVFKSLWAKSNEEQIPNVRAYFQPRSELISSLDRLPSIFNPIKSSLANLLKDQTYLFFWGLSKSPAKIIAQITCHSEKPRTQFGVSATPFPRVPIISEDVSTFTVLHVRFDQILFSLSSSQYPNREAADSPAMRLIEKSLDQYFVNRIDFTTYDDGSFLARVPLVRPDSTIPKIESMIEDKISSGLLDKSKHVDKIVYTLSPDLAEGGNAIKLGLRFGRDALYVGSLAALLRPDVGDDESFAGYSDELNGNLHVEAISGKILMRQQFNLDLLFDGLKDSKASLGNLSQRSIESKKRIADLLDGLRNGLGDCEATLRETEHGLQYTIVVKVK